MATRKQNDPSGIIIKSIKRWCANCNDDATRGNYDPRSPFCYECNSLGWNTEIRYNVKGEKLATPQPIKEYLQNLKIKAPREEVIK